MKQTTRLVTATDTPFQYTIGIIIKYFKARSDSSHITEQCLQQFTNKRNLKKFHLTLRPFVSWSNVVIYAVFHLNSDVEMSKFRVPLQVELSNMMKF